MTRFLYRCLLWLHPPAFRRRFGEEMLWIFDEAPADRGTARLLVDAFISLGRQWVVRSGMWKLLAAAVGGVLTLAMGLALQPRLPRELDGIQIDSPQGFFVLTALAALLAISLTLILCVIWFRLSRRYRA